MDKELIKQVAKKLGENPTMVARSIDHYERFIVDVIKSGKLENVRIPLFGTFKVNLKKLQYLVDAATMPKCKVIKRQKKSR